MIENDLKNFPKVISSSEEIKCTTHIQDTTQIMVDVPVLPRWLSDILTTFKAESVNYTQLKAKYDLTMISYADLEQLSWIEENDRIVDLAVALGMWVVEDE